MNSEKKKIEFSKTLLKQESALIWIMSLSFIVLAFYCIYQGFTGSLPWLAAMVGFPWTAYGVSQAMYYRKSMAENTCGGIKYETVIAEAQKIASQYQNAAAVMDDTDPYMEEFNYETTENVDDYQI